MIDTAKTGEVMALAMDKLEQLNEAGEIPNNTKVGAAYIVVALDYPTPDDHPERLHLPDTMTDVFVFGIPSEIYIQEGVLRLGLENRYEGGGEG